MRAQSNGEWPGSSRTLRLGLEGLDECVGGGASPEEEAGGPRFGTGPCARWGEFAAGNWLRDGMRPGCGMRRAGGGGGGGIAELAAFWVDGSGDSEKLGTGSDGAAGSAFGVVCSSASGSAMRGVSSEGGWMLGMLSTGGGGMARLSRSSSRDIGFISEGSSALSSPRSCSSCEGRCPGAGPPVMVPLEPLHCRKSDGSQAGGRTRTQTTEAKRRERPIIPIVSFCEGKSTASARVRRWQGSRPK